MRPLLAALLLSLAIPASAQAVVTGPPRALEMVGRMAVLPPHDAQIVLAPCPVDPAFNDGCEFEGGVIYVDPDCWMCDDRMIRNALYHELGHRFAAEQPRVVRGFRRLTGMQRRSAYLIGERFADAYADCAFDAMPGSWRFIDGYGYEPTRREHRKACALIRNL